MQKLRAVLEATGRKVTGWKTTAAGAALVGLGAYMLYRGQGEGGWAAIVMGATFVLGVDDTKAGARSQAQAARPPPGKPKPARSVAPPRPPPGKPKPARPAAPPGPPLGEPKPFRPAARPGPRPE